MEPEREGDRESQWVSATLVNTRKLLQTCKQVATSLSIKPMSIRMRSQLLVPSCLTNLEQVASILVDNFVGLVTSCLNKSDIALLAT